MQNSNQQGVQGSYNRVTKLDTVTELKLFGQQWVEEMAQELRYNEKAMARWKEFASK
jgi:hypothetical protein